MAPRPPRHQRAPPARALCSRAPAETAVARRSRGTALRDPTPRAGPIGVELLFAADGETGLELARTQLPDVITLDIGLPGIDGWQVLSGLRSYYATAEIGVIVLTAHAQKSMEQAAADLGADGFLAKPFRPVDLRQAVTALLARVPAEVPVR